MRSEHKEAFSFNIYFNMKSIRTFKGFISESIVPLTLSQAKVDRISGWNISDNTRFAEIAKGNTFASERVRGTMLTKEFSFDSQTELAEFLLKVARLADENDHHPDAEIYNGSKLRLKLFTHSENAISDLDRKLAKSIDSI